MNALIFHSILISLSNCSLFACQVKKQTFTKTEFKSQAIMSKTKLQNGWKICQRVKLLIGSLEIMIIGGKM